MNHLEDLHEQAMDYADQAFIAKRRGNLQLSEELSRKALQFEVDAVELVKGDLSSEPTRSILFRSAASLAIDCGEYREAERLISNALVGNPPLEIAEELRDLLEQVNFNRHLKLQNVDLTSEEIQMSIAGSAVGFGFALSEIFVERVKDMERLIFRTVERMLGKVFRERGAATRPIQDSYQLYLAAPRAGSFAVTLRLGRQMELPSFDLSTQIIDEILACFELLNQSDDEKLREKIPQEPYYQNFIGLAKRIAPDGDKVKMVGFTKVHDGKEVGLAFTRKQTEIIVTPSSGTGKTEPKNIISVKGRLLLADARKPTGMIQLIEENDTYHSIVIPEGMMDDIVKPLWDEDVVVTGYRLGKKIQLVEINKVDH